HSLIQRAGFKILNSRSLECQPCIHSHSDDLVKLSLDKIIQIANLEQRIGQYLFDPYDFNNAQGIQQIIEFAKQQTDINNYSLERYDMGCGSQYACGE